ncbi:uncharacterized protein KY384_002253 [Bacidia gigantensis]|uniref:uncharacterized protein n=1 Tax=Bacidia gigantensis TaxID=2732470 RepID=UPI001D0510EE|nr:uncharacterized protein KY384_002253 [Bacidia gigantensis]KAG8533470.1 hypothetical protein KY384_002253 [Bacidia gigantensis]
MDAWKSWALFGGTAIVIGYYYATTGGQKKRGSGWRPFSAQETRTGNASKQRNSSRDNRAKETERAKLPEDTSDASAASPQGGVSDKAKKRREVKNKQPSKLAQSSAAEVNYGSGQDTAEKDQDEEDNLEFAKQLSDKMTGTSLKKPEGTQNKKARKQAKRAEAAIVPESKLDSLLYNRGDADDDFSSANSADLGVTNTTTPSGADISDMLEPPTKGPSILRLTEPANPQPQRQPKAQKPVQEQETKKQRQNRRKREEEKTLREEAERQRQKLLENQRRTAREAEGRPAKNGLGSSQPPAKNAWSTTTSNGGNNNTTKKAAPPQHTDLLDTFEDVTTGANAPAAGKSTSNGMSYGSLPSEEEQISMLKELDSDNGWNTVAKGGKKKRPNVPASEDESSNSAQETKAKPTGASNGESSFPKGAPGTALKAQANGVAKTTKAPKEQVHSGKATRETLDHGVWNRSNIHEHPDYDPAFPYALTGHPDDSDWAVV